MNHILELTPKLSRRDFTGLGLGAALLASAGAQARTSTTASPAPDFTLRSVGGPNLRLAEQRGRVVMLNFWATWCAPCREEMPHLSRIHDKYQASGFTLLGVNVDDNASNATTMATKLGLKFPVLLDTDKTVVKLYAVTSMPSTVLIDRDGQLRHVHKGYKSGDEDSYEQLMRSLLKE